MEICLQYRAIRRAAQQAADAARSHPRGPLWQRPSARHPRSAVCKQPRQHSRQPVRRRQPRPSHVRCPVFCRRPDPSVTTRPKMRPVEAVLVLLLILALPCACRPPVEPVRDAGVPSDCRDPVLASKFPQCIESTNQSTCTNAGGRWSQGPFGQVFCNCPTGEKDCTCTSANQCLSTCGTDLTGDTGSYCSDVTEGTCSEWNADFGCRCRFTEDGDVEASCYD